MISRLVGILFIKRQKLSESHSFFLILSFNSYTYEQAHKNFGTR